MATDSLCLTPACIQAAAQLAGQIAPNWKQYDPCSQFDQMVCARFRDHRGDDARNLVDVSDENARILRSILESDYKTATEYVTVQWNSTFPVNSVDEGNYNNLRRDYQACMDIDAIAKEGTKPLVSLLAELQGIFPVITSDLKTTIGEKDYDSFNKAIFYLEELGVSTFVTLSAGPDPTDSRLKAAKVNRNTFAHESNHSIYEDPQGPKLVADDVTQVFLDIIPGNITKDEAAALGEAVSQLEFDIVRATPGETEEPVSVTINDLGKMVPPLGLDRVLSLLVPADFPANGSLSIVVPGYVANLSSILTSHSKTALMSYLLYKTTKQLGEYIINDASDIASSKRWSTCVTRVGETQPYTLARFFASATFPDSTKEFTDRMATTLRSQFKERIDTLDWMSAESKRRAHKKLENIVQNVGYPAIAKDPTAIAEHYKDLNITSSYFGNALSARRHKVATAWTDLTKPFERYGRLDGYPTWTANAGYARSHNSININAGVQQLPFFSEQLPGYATFGGLGTVVGHEILHGFDSEGHTYDENGVAGNSLLDEATLKAFEKKSQCFVDQYSKYEYDLPGGKKGKTNGTTTLAENLSDAGGLRIAYDAWKKTQAAAKDKNLPGLEGFTHEQLFFMFYGNLWCNSVTPEHNAKNRPTDDHAADAHRIMGAAVNSRGFKEAFNCKVKEPECELF
ncbi:hypothetical protein QBC39DRAFT_127096 [Podospora conica]|nr:hypothetical protein QBC39DRAFT_127096 [Schizothecium conicum]